MRTQLLGGTGDDQVSADISNQSNKALFGGDRISLAGGAGDDDLTLNFQTNHTAVDKTTHAPLTSVTVSGGSGFDVDTVASPTAFTTLSGCEYNL